MIRLSTLLHTATASGVAFILSALRRGSTHLPVRRILYGTLTGILAGVLAITMAGPASAAGNSYNNTLPYETGCGAGAQVFASKSFRGGTINVVTSPRCGTNWVEWYGPRKRVGKRMFKSGYGYTTIETDTATWSYSRQVYAPGTTAIQLGILVDGWRMTASCSNRCSFGPADHGPI